MTTSAVMPEEAEHAETRYLFPGVPITLKALKPKNSDFEPQTLGQHARKRHLALMFTQTQVAKQFRVNPWTVLNWEKGKTDPPIESIPAIIQFLGYDPFPKPKSLPECLLAKRRAMGWSIKKAARQLGVDEETWGVWERGATVPMKRLRLLLDTFLPKR